MIYLVSKDKSLFTSENYKILEVEEALSKVHNWDCIQFDTETSGRDAHICDILCYQLGNDTTDERIVVDNTHYPVTIFKEELESKLLIGHNLKFDIQFLYKYSIIPSKVWDTMIIEQLLHLGFSSATFRVSLKEVAYRRLNVDMDKSTRGEIIWRGLDEKVILYSAYDVVYLEQIYKQQLKECNYTKCLNGAKLENSFVPTLAYMEWCGIHLDVKKWTDKMKKDEESYNKALNALNAWAVKYSQEHPEFPKMYKEAELYLFEEMNTGPTCIINWSSSRQVIPIMEALGFKVDDEDKKTGKAKKSVQEKVIIKQKGINDEFLKLYFDVKQAKIVCDTFGQKYIDSINPITNRIHTTFKQLGASSGRMSCGSTQENTDLKKYKHLGKGNCTFPQLQNLPSDHETRMAFTPMSGNLLASADYSALESRLGADIYNEESMLEEYLHGSGDIHSLTAKHIFKELANVPVKEIKEKYPEFRKKAKPVEFSQQFGGSAKAIQNSLGCSYQEAKEIADNYNNGFKGIAEFKKKGSSFVRSNGYVLISSVTGNRIYWEDWHKWREIEDTPEYIRNKEYSKEEIREHNMAASKWDRMSLNSPTQGTGACIVKLAAYKFFKWILQNNLFNKVLLCNMVHDEIVIEFPENIKEEAVNALTKAMETSASVFCKKLPIPAEAEVGLGWIH